MEKQPFIPPKKSVLGYIITIFLLLAIGVFSSWKIYFAAGGYSLASLIPVVTVSLVIFFLGVTYQKLGVLCPKCKAQLQAHYERMENDTDTWLQIQFPCEKCGIVWDTGEKGNLRKYGKYN